jgi:hypothetical protein
MPHLAMLLYSAIAKGTTLGPGATSGTQLTPFEPCRNA